MIFESKNFVSLYRTFKLVYFSMLVDDLARKIEIASMEEDESYLKTVSVK